MSDHIVILTKDIKPIVNPFAVRCNRCGKELQVSMPVSIDMIVGLEKLFAREHKSCKQNVTGAGKQ